MLKIKWSHNSWTNRLRQCLITTASVLLSSQNHFIVLVVLRCGHSLSNVSIQMNTTYIYIFGAFSQCEYCWLLNISCRSLSLLKHYCWRHTVFRRQGKVRSKLLTTRNSAQCIAIKLQAWVNSLIAMNNIMSDFTTQ